MEVLRLFDLLDRYKSLFDKNDALAEKVNKEWKTVSVDSYVEDSKLISYGLMALGIKPGDRIATISTNCPEWNILDMGIMQCGAIHVPIYPTISESDYRYILKHSGVKMVFASGADLLRKINHIIPEIPEITHVFTFKTRENYRSYKEVVDLGRKNPEGEKLSNIKQSIKAEDMATLIYTSGTTGNPKGVMLSHQNIISNFKACSPIVPVGSEGRSLSYLPLCHIYERMMNYLFQYNGISVFYAENLGTIVENLKEVKPDILTTVPRLLEKVYDKINQQGRKLKGIKRAMFFWSLKLGLRFETNRNNGWWYHLKLGIANALVFNKWRAALGNNMKVIVSGGAALQPRLGRVFWAAKIPILEGYGLTETSPVICVSNWSKHGVEFGTVGPVLPSVDVKIDYDGEILSKSSCVMMGYYNEPELTKEVIDDDGWFHTGDLGHITEKGNIKITGRKKSIFKTSFGKYVSPQIIENKITESPFVDTLVVVGENQKFAAALIIPDFTHLRTYCKIKGIPYDSNEEIVRNQTIIKRYKKEIDKYNVHFGSYEQVKKIALLSKEWTQESGELTPSLKIRRNIINERYKDVIESLFSN